MNQFLKSLHKGTAQTWNGAVSNSSTGSTLADQFGRAGAQRGRDIKEVFAEQGALHRSGDPLTALKFAFYLRTITRKVRFEDSATELVQKGQGNRDESLKRLLWYYMNERELFFKNLWLLPYVGRYKDIFDLMYLAKQNGMDLDDRLLEAAMVESDLVLKYMPVVRAKSKLKTDRARYNNEIAKAIANYLGLTYTQLRKHKSAGKAHQWQQLISKKLFDKINFAQIPGKALFQMVTSKFLKNHGLEAKYTAWLETQPIAKFTGYVYELGTKVKAANSPYVKMTLDKQFLGLLDMNRNAFGGRKVICALDTSGSMTSSYGMPVTPLTICLSLGVYFSSLMEGPFHNWAISFDNVSKWFQMKGESFSEKYMQAERIGSWGCTNFESVIDSFVDMRKRFPAIPESDFPDTVLVVSDMQFNPVKGDSMETNYQAMVRKLSSTFSREYCDKFTVVWWQVNGYTSDMPQTMDEPGGYVVSGFDGAIISALLGGKAGNERNMEDAIKEAFDQEVLNMIEI